MFVKVLHTPLRTRLKLPLLWFKVTLKTLKHNLKFLQPISIRQILSNLDVARDKLEHT